MLDPFKISLFQSDLGTLFLTIISDCNDSLDPDHSVCVVYNLMYRPYFARHAITIGYSDMPVLSSHQKLFYCSIF